ncbi:MAG: Nif3-like dinuclear metal center hexameric protein [Mycobacteriales bacterium]|nr:MAG: Nif3-like dinuclear metal center hexameric protein [Pseudonocardiales bacterium]
MADLGEVVAALDRLYDPVTAQTWDAVGLVCGDPAARVRRVRFAVDPVAVVVDEAEREHADLLVTHHPLLLHGVHSVAATTPKGRVVHRLIRAGIALHVAHTNADCADPGVSDALAGALGLRDLVPLDAADRPPRDKLITFVPETDADRLVEALSLAGAGVIGDYARCAFLGPGTGTFTPGPSSHPTIGRPGVIEQVPELRLEMELPRARRGVVVAALRAAHPYEEPAYDVVELAAEPGRCGLGRIGELSAPEPLSAFVQRVAAALPATVAGVRATGDPELPIRRVAVCGGAGDSLLTTATAADVDALVTADLRHHPASEHAETGGPALVDVAHWASEWPWLRTAADRLATELDDDTVDFTVSTIVTDPWTLRALHHPA